VPDIGLSIWYAADGLDGTACPPRVLHALSTRAFTAGRFRAQSVLDLRGRAGLRQRKTVERNPGAGQLVCEAAAGVWLRAFIEAI
jgi:hypothetical protein